MGALLNLSVTSCSLWALLTSSMSSVVRDGGHQSVLGIPPVGAAVAHPGRLDAQLRLEAHAVVQLAGAVIYTKRIVHDVDQEHLAGSTGQEK